MQILVFTTNTDMRALTDIHNTNQYANTDWCSQETLTGIHELTSTTPMQIDILVFTTNTDMDTLTPHINMQTLVFATNIDMHTLSDIHNTY